MVLSCAASIDGYTDDASGERLVLSNEADLDSVDGLRAACDAILVGAGTIRRDDPSLLVRSPGRRNARIGRGLPASPVKVTLTAGTYLDPAARFFTTGTATRLVYAAALAASTLRARLGAAATVVDAGDPVSLPGILADLAGRGIRRLIVEGGTAVRTQFLTLDLADELRLAIAPLLVGDSAAPRLAGDGVFRWTASHRAVLAGVSQVGDMAVLRYALSPGFDPDACRDPAPASPG